MSADRDATEILSARCIASWDQSVILGGRSGASCGQCRPWSRAVASVL